MEKRKYLKRRLVITIRLTKEEKAIVVRSAKAQGISMEQYVRDCIIYVK